MQIFVVSTTRYNHTQSTRALCSLGKVLLYFKKDFDDLGAENPTMMQNVNFHGYIARGCTPHYPHVWVYEVNKDEEPKSYDREALWELLAPEIAYQRGQYS